MGTIQFTEDKGTKTKSVMISLIKVDFNVTDV